MPPVPLPIPRLAQPVVSAWPVPGSKSVTNRALVLAALAEGESVLTGALASDDTRRMVDCLRDLGIEVIEDGPLRLRVRGGRSRLRAPAKPLFVGNSGTTVRFLAALAALVPGPVELAGDEDMARRPIGDLVDGLRQLGVRVDCPTGCPPLTVHGGRLAGGTVRMRGDRSSQYFSALLLVGSAAEAGLRIAIDGELVSRPYVTMSCRMVADFGGRAEADGDGFACAPAPLRACGYAIEPDASAASYPFALAAAGGHRLAVPGLDATCLQGDYAFLGVLERMGALVERRAGSTLVAGTGRLVGIDADLHHISDTVMTLAAIAPLCDGPTTIRNIANIRLKETDRLSATATELRRLGQEVDEGPDWLRIAPRPLRPATVACYRDHRMAMAFAVLGACSGQIAIADPACTAKTYPGFWDDLGSLYPRSPW